jgi:hypothetical protein
MKQDVTYIKQLAFRKEISEDSTDQNSLLQSAVQCNLWVKKNQQSERRRKLPVGVEMGGYVHNMTRLLCAGRRDAPTNTVEERRLSSIK